MRRTPPCIDYIDKKIDSMKEAYDDMDNMNNSNDNEGDEDDSK